jgi:heavy metal sensor kinase
MTALEALESRVLRFPGLRSLRGRITLFFGSILAACVTAYSIAVGVFFTGHVNAELDRRVHEDVELATRAVVVDAAGRASWAGGFLGKQVEEEAGGGHWIEVWNEGGERLLGTGTIEDPDLGPPVRPRRGTTRTAPSTAGPLRVLSEMVLVGDRSFVVRAAVLEAGTRAQIRTLWFELVAVSATVLLLGGIGGLLLARRVLGPLSRMAEHARRITAEELHERLKSDGSGVELDLLRDSFNETLARLERSFDQLRRFTADASHELRTPLTALRSVGEVALRGSRTEDEYRDVIGTMLEEVDRLSRLADELLTLARAEAGSAHLKLEQVDLTAIAAEVVEQLSVLAEERGQNLVTDLVSSAPVRGDRLALRQALLNLVDNAIKYAPEGSSITVRSGSAARAAFVEVADEGPGIAPEHQGRVFERFYRVDQSRSRDAGGTGLGLSLVKWAAEAHGGRVELESTVGKGSRFRMALPLAGESDRRV